MQCLNKCLRDPVFYRCKTDVPHHQHGFKYKAYPTYDFACPCVDSIEGITHALRTVEYKDRDEMYQWVQDKTKSRKVDVVEFSKTQFSHTVLSKRKLAWFVDNGKVEGWNDPRFPTVQGVLRRGMRVDALSEFVVKQGMSKATNLMEWDQIWSINKQKIDPIVPRFAAVSGEGAVRFHLSGIDGIVCSSEKKHPKNEELGERLLMKSPVVLIDQEDAQDISNGEELTLLHWGNAFADKIEKDKSGNVTKITGRLNPEGNPKTTKKKIHWVADLPQHITPLTLREFDHLVTKEKIEDGDNIEDIINPCSVIDTVAIGDPVLKTLQAGTSIQLERRGFYIVDQAAFPPGKPMVLNKIPDGKAKDMGMKSKVDPSKLQGGSADKGKKSDKAAEAKAAAAPAAAVNGGGGGPVDEAAVKACGDEIRLLKEKLKGEGLSGKKINEHAGVKELVDRLTKLKEGGPAPAAAAPAPEADAKKKDAKPKPAAKAGERPIEDVTRLNIRVGKIVKVWEHPESDKLWCEEIDLGEAAPRQIASGLRHHVKKEEMEGAIVCVCANLKPRKLVGFESQGMVLCGTSSSGKVELLHAPKGAKLGERITIEGTEMLEPDDKLNEKTGKAPWVVVQPGFSMNGSKQATYKGALWQTSAGPVNATTLTEGTIS